MIFDQFNSAILVLVSVSQPLKGGKPVGTKSQLQSIILGVFKNFTQGAVCKMQLQKLLTAWGIWIAWLCLQVCLSLSTNGIISSILSGYADSGPRLNL